jgi:hypothetical protein
MATNIFKAELVVRSNADLGAAIGQRVQQGTDAGRCRSLIVLDMAPEEAVRALYQHMPAVADVRLEFAFLQRNECLYPCLGAFTYLKLKSYVQLSGVFDNTQSLTTNYVVPVDEISELVLWACIENEPIFASLDEVHGDTTLVAGTCLRKRIDVPSESESSCAEGVVVVSVGITSSGLIISLVNRESNIVFANDDMLLAISTHIAALIQQSIIRACSSSDPRQFHVYMNRGDALLLQAFRMLQFAVDDRSDAAVEVVQLSRVRDSQLCAATGASKLPTEIVLMMGQSNMAGRGTVHDLQLNILRERDMQENHNLQCLSESVRNPVEATACLEQSSEQYQQLIDLTVGTMIGEVQDYSSVC